MKSERSVDPKMGLDVNKIDELAQIINKYGLTELEIKDEGCKITLKKTSVAIQSIPQVTANQIPVTSTEDLTQNSNSDFTYITEMKAIQDQLEVSKGKPVLLNNDANNEIVQQDTDSDGICVKSPIAGIFYRQSMPGNPPYVNIGDRVKKGQTLCLVEAMKMINEIYASCDGIIKEFFAENEQFVEFGASLVLIEEG